MLARSTNAPALAEHQGRVVMIAVVNYGAGNLTSVKKALDWIGQECVITSVPVEVERATKLILPGVGHFAATASLAKLGLQEVIENAIYRGVPFLGICVGMQWMFEGSAESPETPGLGLLSGTCEHFPSGVKSPHVGWNQIQVSDSSRLFRGLRSAFVYFTHSFRAPLNQSTTAGCEYGGTFSAAVEKDNAFGVQFHPEKSSELGLKLLRNFCEL
jgi:imidazole glycerol-phosphate synthase subunit HisH